MTKDTYESFPISRKHIRQVIRAICLRQVEQGKTVHASMRYVIELDPSLMWCVDQTTFLKKMIHLTVAL